MPANSDFQYLAKELEAELNAEGLQLVRRAYDLAESAHEGQFRDEGSPYIVHPVRVASSLVDELQIFSPTLLCSALMHDVIEDSDTTRMQIERSFGNEIAEIVWLLTKFEDVSLADYLAAIEEAADTGAPIVKLCDRLDNLRSINGSPKLEKKHRYIRTTEAYYLPLARRTNEYLFEEISRTLDEVKEHVNSLR